MYLYGGVLRITRNASQSPAVARQAVPTVTVSNIPSSYTSRNPLLKYEIFYFSTCWIFKKVEIFGVRRVKRVKFRGDWSNRCWDRPMTIFRIFKMAIAGRFSKCGHFRGWKGEECQSASAFHISRRSVTLLIYYGDFSIIIGHRQAITYT